MNLFFVSDNENPKKKDFRNVVENPNLQPFKVNIRIDFQVINPCAHKKSESFSS